jgi:adenylosuccinate synthase
MGKIAVIGALWGDEGKGKIVDYLSERFDLVVRFQGGSNAGHTVFSGNTKVVLHTVPSGIFHTNTLIAHGVVIDPLELAEEVTQLKKVTSDLSNLKIADNATVVTAYHKLIDGLQDQRLGIGTTRKGIGPAYEDIVKRIAIKLKDLFRPDLDQLLRANIYEKEFLLKNLYHIELPNFDEVKEKLVLAAKYLRPHMTNDLEYQKKFSNILFEGAQGVLLDINYGTYPFVTASNTTIAGIFNGATATDIDEIIGVTKIYSTRIGQGPMPTEDNDLLGQLLRERGKEFGSTTGRARRCGPLDLPLLRYSIQVSGITSLALTKLDVLQKIPIKICYAYRWRDQIRDTYDLSIDLNEVEPIYHTLPAFSDNDPSNFQTIIDYLRDQLKIEIKIITFGEDRNCVKILKDF